MKSTNFKTHDHAGDQTNYLNLASDSNPAENDESRASDDAPRAQTVIFIGTAETTRQAQRLLDLNDASQWNPIGCVLVGPEHDTSALASVLVEPKSARARNQPATQITGATTSTTRTTCALTHGVPTAQSQPMIFAEDPSRTEYTLPTIGSLAALTTIAQSNTIDIAIVCLPSGMSRTISRVRSVLQSLGITERFVPPIGELLERTPPYTIGLGQERSSAGTGNAGAVDPAQLLGRPARTSVAGAIASVVEHKRVMITGAGGSIGSEIARIVAEHTPSSIILMERSENALFEIDRSIARKYPDIQRFTVLNDVVDADLTLHHVKKYQPQIIFHAAAHKHVPLMEDHPAHAVTNNLFGTKSVADAAAASGCEKFVLISSDKAVNPSSVMGATKRLAELYVQGLHARLHDGVSINDSNEAPTQFSMVRFGNVLGSACSVLQIWAAQVADGGPITITDPRMTRYFMTIPEAAALVIQAAGIDAAQSNAALVHVLDMGDPVRIVDLAMSFARAMAFAPMIDNKDACESYCATKSAHALPTMQICTTGIRPGEKLHEELAQPWETLQPTVVPGVRGWRSPQIDTDMIKRMVADLDSMRHRRDWQAVVAAIHRWVPNMQRAAA